MANKRNYRGDHQFRIVTSVKSYFIHAGQHTVIDGQRAVITNIKRINGLDDEHIEVIGTYRLKKEPQPMASESISHTELASPIIH